MSTYKAVSTPWVRVTGPHVLCAVNTCPFYHHGDSDPDAHKSMNAARLHVEQTGHEVIVQEGRSRRVVPQTSTYIDD